MRIVAALAAAVAVVASARLAAACAPAPRPGAAVAIAGEEALIGYDPATGREDFVRRASFRTTERDFGFLVPTPTRPALGEADDAIFAVLAHVVEPRVVETQKLAGFEITTLCLAGRSMKASAVALAHVDVLETKRVAGFDAAILAADDADALAKWLADHGYDARPALRAWLEPYVARRWMITAFKVASKDDPGAGFGTRAVRMTFTTDKPFFPYREPEDQRAAAAGDRLLRVYLVTAGRMDGAIASGAPWPGKATWAGPLVDSARRALPFAAPEGVWLTAFEDAASPRPGVDDLIFSPSASHERLEPPPVVYVREQKLPIPIELLGGGLLIGVALGVRSSRRARAKRG